MRCIRTLGFTTIALLVGGTSTFAAVSGVASTNRLVQLMDQKLTMSKSADAKNNNTDNALRNQASAFRASMGRSNLALSEQHLGQSSVFTLRPGLTSQLGSPIATDKALAPNTRVQGVPRQSSALSMEAKTLIDTSGPADRAFSFRTK